jgi:hypothetical protein
MITNEIKTLLPFITWSGGSATIRCNLVQDVDHNTLLILHNGAPSNHPIREPPPIRDPA